MLSSIVRSTMSGVRERVDSKEEPAFALIFSRLSFVLSSRAVRRCLTRSELWDEPAFLSVGSSTSMTISSTSSSSSDSVISSSMPVPSSSVIRDTTVRNFLFRLEDCSSPSSGGVESRRFLV